MDIKEAKQIIDSMELPPEALSQANAVLEAVADQNNLTNEEIDRILAIIDKEVDTDALKTEPIEDIV